ncbi:MAG: APC family permease [Oscillospiraceae bacterium]|nr:APC family permease [Oscillospiraceae bacterium]
MKEKILSFFLGRRLEDTELSEEKFNVLWGIPIFASDAISSVSYAGEEILLVLIPVLGMASFSKFMPIVGAIICLLAILVFCYRQTIEAYPEGGGAYIVASDNLGEKIGLIAGGSLIMDYILTVAVSSCAGAAAVTSAFPALIPHKALIAFLIICLLTWGNLRGIRDSSVMFGIPTYLFILTMLTMIVTGIVKYSLGMVSPSEAAIVAANNGEIAKDAMIILILKAFASGCTALTGVEAVSNGVPNFKDPAPQHAKKVLLAMAGFVCIIFLGVSTLITLYKIVPSEEATAVSKLAAAVYGDGSLMFYVTQIMTVVILSLAANTAFADLPLLMALIAGHGYLPKQLVNRGSRLNFSNGILFLFGMASVLVFVFRGDQHLLLPLYASGVFISFFLSQLGMFTHWRRKKGPHWQFKAAVNGFGTVLTGTVLVIIVIMKFLRGAWVALLLIAFFIFVMLKIKQHYQRVGEDLMIASEREARELLGRAKPGKAILPVQSMNRSFIKTLNCALGCGFSELELYSVCSTEEQAQKLKKQIEALGIDCSFVYDVTTLRNTSDVLLKHVREEAELLHSGRNLTVMMGGLVVTSPFAKILHNSTTHRLMKKMETYRNVSVFTVPYVI